MNRPYLIYIDGKLAQKTLTLARAKRVMEELRRKGYRNVSVAEEIC